MLTLSLLQLDFKARLELKRYPIIGTATNEHLLPGKHISRPKVGFR